MGNWFEEKMILDFMLSNNSCWMGDQPDGENWFEEKMILDFMLFDNMKSKIIFSSNQLSPSGWSSIQQLLFDNMKSKIIFSSNQLSPSGATAARGHCSPL